MLLIFREPVQELCVGGDRVRGNSNRKISHKHEARSNIQWWCRVLGVYMETLECEG
jgi:hypothetical protein